MGEFHVLKDGWRVWITEGRAHWVEAYPTWSEQCKTCSGTGYVRNHNCGCDDNVGMGWGCDCQHKCSCEMVHGVGMARDKPEHPMPSPDILLALEAVLSKEIKAFGIRLNEGAVEQEIAKKKALEASAKGACL